MKSTAEILDAVRAELHLPSDYALQGVLGVTKSQISRYRTGKDSLGDDAAIKAADILGIERCVLLAWIAGERARSPSSRDAWRLLAERLGGTAAAVLFVWLIAGSGAESQTLAALLPAVDAGTLCIMLNAIFLIILLIFSVLASDVHKEQ